MLYIVKQVEETRDYKTFLYLFLVSENHSLVIDKKLSSNVYHKDYEIYEKLVVEEGFRQLKEILGVPLLLHSSVFKFPIYWNDAESCGDTTKWACTVGDSLIWFYLNPTTNAETLLRLSAEIQE